MKRLVSLFSHRSNDVINARILFLCGFFTILHFSISFCYLEDILSSGYKSVYKIHSITAFFSHSVFFAGIITFIIILCARKLGDKAVSIIFSSIITIVFLLVIIDIALFRIYHFHINWYIISEMTQPDFSRSSGIGVSFFISSILEFLFAFLIISFLTSLVLRAPRPRFGISFKRALKVISIIVIAVVLAEKIFMIAISYNRPAYIYKLEDSMPVFYLSIGEYIYKPINSYLNIADGKESFDTITSEYDGCKYPLPYDKSTAKFTRKKNIIFILTESTRWDVIDKTATPSIYDMSRSNSIVSECNFSGSNSTHLGLFSVIYGINPFYNILIKTKKTESFPVRVLRDNGYRTRLFMSASTKWHRMDLFLNQNFDDIYVPHETTPLTRDAEIEKDVVKSIPEIGNRPNMFFIFFDSSHYPFSFPENDAPFKPYFNGGFDKTDFMMLSKNKNLLMNSYRNSLRHLDGFIGNIISALKSSGQYRNTIIVYSGDHGCEFGETGKYFYSSSLSSYATRVPLIIHDPSLNTGRKINLSSHIDIFPTLFDLLGYTGDRSNFEGASLLSDNKNPYEIVTYQDVLTPYRYSINDNGFKLVVDYKSSRFIIDKTDINDRPVDTIADERKRIGFLKQQIDFFSKTDSRNN